MEVSWGGGGLGGFFRAFGGGGIGEMGDLVASAWASSGSLGGCGENLVEKSWNRRVGLMEGWVVCVVVIEGRE